MSRAMCSQKVVDRKTTEEQIGMLGNYRLVNNSKCSLMLWTCADEG